MKIRYEEYQFQPKKDNRIIKNISKITISNKTYKVKDDGTTFMIVVPIFGIYDATIDIRKILEDGIKYHIKKKWVSFT